MGAYRIPRHAGEIGSWLTLIMTDFGEQRQGALSSGAKVIIESQATLQN